MSTVPAIVVIADDVALRDELVGMLGPRFELDYRTLAVSGGDAEALLRWLTADRSPVAVVIASPEAGDAGGVSALAEAHRLHRGRGACSSCGGAPGALGAGVFYGAAGSEAEAQTGRHAGSPSSSSTSTWSLPA